MTREHEGHFAKKHSPDRPTNPSVVDAVKDRSPNRQIACAVAFEIVESQNVPPEEVGFTIDTLEVKVIKCQLGLFGYQPTKRIVKPSGTVTPALKAAIQNSMVQDRLSCKAAWDIAAQLGLRKLEVASACEAMGLKISSCQLGTF